MTDNDVDILKAQIKNCWEKASAKQIQEAIKFNQKIVEQFEIRIGVLRGLLNGNDKPDYKTKQFSD